MVQSSESRPVPSWMNYFLVKEEEYKCGHKFVCSLTHTQIWLIPLVDGPQCWLLMASVTSVWFSSVQLDLFIFQIFIDFRRWTCWLWMVGCYSYRHEVVISYCSSCSLCSRPIWVVNQSKVVSWLYNCMFVRSNACLCIIVVVLGKMGCLL